MADPTDKVPQKRLRMLRRTRSSHLHANLHACGGGVVHAGAVVIVGGIDVGLLILASLQSGTSPAQYHLAATGTEKKNKNNRKRQRDEKRQIYF